MQYPASELVIDPVLIRSHNVAGPRYTSYPTADRFVEAFGETELRQWLPKRNIGGISQPLSVYVHLPFCENVCYYCGCNKVVTRDHGRSAKYIKYLEKELALLGPLLGADRKRQDLQLRFRRGQVGLCDAPLRRKQLRQVRVAVERDAVGTERDHLVERGIVFVEALSVLIVGRPDPADRRDADPQHVAVGVSGIALEVALQAALRLGDRQLVAGTREV
ncbi:MAG TPA: hypothetical protein VEL04_09100, partial [Burkholderiales bacterium]|nr:hypothetical protein [Burkholderiales bacterium]